MKKTILTCAVSATCLLGLVSEASAVGVVVYREVFPFVEDPEQYDSDTNATAGTSGEDRANRLIQQGWYGGNTGDNFATVGVNDTPGTSDGAGEGTLETTSNTTGNAEPGAINSSPVPNDSPPTGRAFQSQRAIGNLFLYTDEVLLDSALVTHVAWQSRNSRNDTNSVASTETALADKWSDQGSADAVDSHVAFRIDTGSAKNWYVSLEGFLQSGDASMWRDNGTFTDPLSWVLFDTDPTGATLPGANFATILADLPSGTIDAAGLYTSRSGGNLRIDNYSISAVPLPAAAWMLLSAMGGLGALGWRKRRTAA